MLQIRRRLSFTSSRPKANRGISSAAFDFASIPPSPQQPKTPGGSGLRQLRRKQSKISAAPVPVSPVTPQDANALSRVSKDADWRADEFFQSSKNEAAQAVPDMTAHLPPSSFRQEKTLMFRNPWSHSSDTVANEKGATHVQSVGPQRKGDTTANVIWTANLDVQPPPEFGKVDEPLAEHDSFTAEIATVQRRLSLSVAKHQARRLSLQQARRASLSTIADHEETGSHLFDAKESSAPASLSTFSSCQSTDPLCEERIYMTKARNPSNHQGDGCAAYPSHSPEERFSTRSEDVHLEGAVPSVKNYTAALPDESLRNTPKRSLADLPGPSQLNEKGRRAKRRIYLPGLDGSDMRSRQLSLPQRLQANGTTLSQASQASRSITQSHLDSSPASTSAEWEPGKQLRERIERLKLAERQNSKRARDRASTAPQARNPITKTSSSSRDRSATATARMSSIASSVLDGGRQGAKRPDHDESPADVLLTKAKAALSKYNTNVYFACHLIVSSALASGQSPSSKPSDLPPSLFSTVTRDLTMPERYDNIAPLMVHLIHAVIHAELCEPVCQALRKDELGIANSMISAIRSRFSMPAALLWEIQLCEALMATRQSHYDSTQQHRMDKTKDWSGRGDGVTDRATRDALLGDLLRRIHRQVTKLLHACGIIDKRNAASEHFEKGCLQLVSALEALYDVTILCGESRALPADSDALALEVSFWECKEKRNTGLGISQAASHERRALLGLDGGAAQSASDTTLESLDQKNDSLAQQPSAQNGASGHALTTVCELGLAGLDSSANVHIHFPGSRRCIALGQVDQ